MNCFIPNLFTWKVTVKLDNKISFSRCFIQSRLTAPNPTLAKDSLDHAQGLRRINSNLADTHFPHSNISYQILKIHLKPKWDYFRLLWMHKQNQWLVWVLNTKKTSRDSDRECLSHFSIKRNNWVMLIFHASTVSRIIYSINFSCKINKMDSNHKKYNENCWLWRHSLMIEWWKLLRPNISRSKIMKKKKMLKKWWKKINLIYKK